MKNLTKNYHTHTARCGHAVGTDREYVESAVRAGFTTLGFSDHAPMPFPDGHESSFRVPLAKAADYFGSIACLREEYQKDIRIFIGLEVEYYPALFPAFLSFIRDFSPDYLILGQHFVYEETPENGSFSDTQVPEKLRRYYRNVLEAVDTGAFLYVAHPDVLHYTGDEKTYETLTRAFLKDLQPYRIPLEINRLGMEEKRIYPRKKFWQLAGEYGFSAVIGMDAHSPAALLDEKSVDACVALADACGLQTADICI